MKKPNLKRICTEGVMIALFVILELFVTVKFGDSIKITFSGLPIILCAVAFGPLSGLLVGLTGSFVAQLVTYGLSVTTVLWIIPAGIRGVVMGLMYIAFKKRRDYLPLLISIVVSSLAVSALNTLVLYIDGNIFGYYNPLTFSGDTLFRFISSVLTAIAYSIVVPVLLKATDKVLVTKKE